MKRSLIYILLGRDLFTAEGQEKLSSRDVDTGPIALVNLDISRQEYSDLASLTMQATI